MVETRVRQGMTAVGAAGVAVAVVVAYTLGSGGHSTAKAENPAPTTSASNVVTVDGAGKAAGKPDTMVTTVTIATTKATPQAALDEASKTMAAVQKVLSRHGVADKDLKTTGISVQPHYNYGNNTQTLQGYDAQEDLQITLRDLAKAGATVTALTAVGGKQVRLGGISLDLEGDSALVAAARKAAFEDAKAKAQQYASLAQRSLGAVVSLTEQVDQPQQPTMYAAAGASADSKAVPIQAGSQNVSVNVTVVWSLN